MIINTPAVAQQSEEHKASPNDNSQEMPFGFKGTPFGDLFKNPEFHSFFKEFPQMPHARNAGTRRGGRSALA